MDARARKIQQVASRLGVSASWLDALINFETGGTYSVFASNPNSSAKGLIQVMDSTARTEFGARDSLELSNKFPTFDAYMDGVVFPYLSKYMPFTTKQSLYLAVFYPAYRYADPLTEFPESVKSSNPGITRVQDYIDYVDRRASNSLFPKTVPLLLLTAGAVIGMWYLMRKRDSRRRYRASLQFIRT